MVPSPSSEHFRRWRPKSTQTIAVALFVCRLPGLVIVGIAASRNVLSPPWCSVHVAFQLYCATRKSPAGINNGTAIFLVTCSNRGLDGQLSRDVPSPLGSKIANVIDSCSEKIVIAFLLYSRLRVRPFRLKDRSTKRAAMARSRNLELSVAPASWIK